MIQQNNVNLINDCWRCFKKNQKQEEIIRLPNCLHQFCKDCLRVQFQEKIQNQNIRIEDFNCHICQTPFNPEITEKFLTLDQLKEQKNVFKVYYKLENDQIKMICFNRLCKKSYTIYDGQMDMQCTHCKKKYCRRCNLEYHEKANNYQTCEQKKADHYQKEFFTMKRVLKLQKCPNCESLCKRKNSFFTTCECGVSFCFLCNKQLVEQEQFTHYENNDPFQSNCQQEQNQPLQQIKNTNCTFCNSQSYKAFKDQITICNTNNCLHKALCLYCQSTVDPKDLGSHFDLVQARCFKQIQDELFSQNGIQYQLPENLHSIDVKIVYNDKDEIIYILALGFVNNFQIITNFKSIEERKEFLNNEILEIESPITCIQFCVGYQKILDKQTIYLGTQNGRVKVVQFYQNRILSELKLIRDIKSFTNKITCIKSFIQNKREYFLVSSYDSTIQLFKITRSFKDNVEHMQTLQGYPQDQILKGHKDPVFWLTLSQNNQESLYMASSGKDEQILIWKWNDKAEKWDIFSKHQKKQFGNRIAFFDSDTIIWQLYKKPIFRVLKHHHVKNQKLIEYDQIKIKDYQQENWENDVDDFPLIQNENNNFLVAKFTDKIYIIKKNLNNSGVFQVQPTLIQCDQYCNLGAVTQDGKFIYLYQYKDKTLMRYKLLHN